MWITFVIRSLGHLVCQRSVTLPTWPQAWQSMSAWPIHHGGPRYQFRSMGGTVIHAVATSLASTPASSIFGSGVIERAAESFNDTGEDRPLNPVLQTSRARPQIADGLWCSWSFRARVSGGLTFGAAPDLMVRAAHVGSSRAWCPTTTLAAEDCASR